MKRALIVGIDSGIGRAFGAALAQRGDIVIGTSRRAGSGAPLDLAAPDAFRAALPQADIAVFCAAMARFSECRDQPDRAHRVNVQTPIALARRLVEAGTRVVLLSTSAVFDGSLPHRRADERTSPRSAYGRFKAEAEAAFLAFGAAASVLRLTKVITPEMPLFTGWAGNLGANRPIHAFADLYFCPVGLQDVVDATITLIDDGSGGIYQVSGGDDCSYLDAARHLARRFGADPGLVKAGCAGDNGIPEEEILRHTSLDTTRLSALTGFVPPAPLSVLAAAWSSYLTVAPAPVTV